MSKYTLLMLSTCCFLLTSKFSLAETKGVIDYRFTENSTQISAVLPFENIITVYGPMRSLTFDRDRKSTGARFSGSTGFNGYAAFVKVRPDKKAVVAGFNHNRSDFWGSLMLAPDNRQNFILMRDPLKGPVQKLKILDDRLPLGLAVNSQNQSILLSTGSGSYTITVFDADLKKIKSKKFGSGGHGGFALTQEGTYVVVGFSKEKRATTEQPMYWEFSPDLEIITQQKLGEEKKSTSEGDALMQVLSYKEDLYVVYGWDKSGISKELPDEVKIKKIRSNSVAWKDDARLPYKTKRRFFISQAGDPYFLEVAKDNLLQTKFNRLSGVVSKRIYNYPDKPTQCFPAPTTIVDVYTDTDGHDNIVLSTRPLNHNEAGCVAIGFTKF